jgi:hypothetical protein
VGREDMLKPTIIVNESLHEASNDNGITAVNSATSKYLAVKSAMFHIAKINICTWTSPHGKITTELIRSW